jgi:hypothetical protein
MRRIAEAPSRFGAESERIVGRREQLENLRPATRVQDTIIGHSFLEPFLRGRSASRQIMLAAHQSERLSVWMPRSETAVREA